VLNAKNVAHQISANQRKIADKELPKLSFIPLGAGHGTLGGRRGLGSIRNIAKDYRTAFGARAASSAAAANRTIVDFFHRETEFVAQYSVVPDSQ